MSLLLFAAACGAAPSTEKPAPPTTADIQREFARARSVDDQHIGVTSIATPVVPGLGLYRVTVGRSPHLWSSAVVMGAEVLVDPIKERDAIVRAWGYGPVRTAPVDDVARAMLLTLDVEEEPTLVTDPAKASYLQRLGVEGVSVPVETTEGGLPGVRFWYGTGENPATEVIVTFAPGGVDLRPGRTHGGG
ncbi:MAG: hypothetical protein Q8P18_16260 [Pseudomonadota bacterium]|nr:hypothetical protein [Pseudomonadota bacterium]